MVMVTGRDGPGGGGLLARRDRRAARSVRLLPGVARAADGRVGAFLTGDIFNLYVWFEVMLMASFVLMALGGERAQLEGGDQVRHAQPGLVGAVPGGGGHPVRGGRHAEHGRPARCASAALDADRAGVRTLARAVPGRLRHQGGDVPALRLAAGLVPHPAGGGDGDLLPACSPRSACTRCCACSRCVFAAGRRPYAPLLLVARRADDGDRRARRGGAVRVPAAAVVPHRQPDRLPADGPGPGYAAGAGRRRCSSWST